MLGSRLVHAVLSAWNRQPGTWHMRVPVFALTHVHIIGTISVIPWVSAETLLPQRSCLSSPPGLDGAPLLCAPLISSLCNVRQVFGPCKYLSRVCGPWRTGVHIYCVLRVPDTRHGPSHLVGVQFMFVE